MRRISFRTAALLGIAAGISLIFAVTAVAQLRDGAKAPEFKLKTLTGKTVSLSQIRKDPKRPGKNRVVVLDFWATYCDPCKMEIPIFKRMQDKYGKDGLVIVGIAEDREGLRVVGPFAKTQKFNYTILLDPTGIAKSAYRVRFYPTTFIIDRGGVIRSVHVGYTPGFADELEQDIKSVL